MGVCPRFLYITMTETKYLRNIKMLMETYKTCYGDCVGDRTINKLSLFIVMFESAEMFEQVAKELKQNLIIDIDRDVDYQVWSRQETWTEHKLKGSPSGNTLTYESLHIDKFSTLANHMTGMLPPVPDTSTDEKEDTKNRKGLTYTERDKFRETINNLTNQSVFNDQVLDYAIQKTLAKLCTALQSIKDNIESKHENILYENLYQKQYFYYTFLMGGDINDLHKKWRNKYLEDQITENSLTTHLEEALVELLKSGVFSDIETNLTNELRTKYKKEINLEEYDIPKKLKPLELYARYRSIYNLKGGKYIIDKVKAGKLIFKLRKDVEKLEAFFKFDQNLFLVYKDIDELKDKNKVESMMDEIDFSQLECKFSEEEMKASGIKECPKTVLPVIDLMTTEKNVPKAYWLCFYCVLLEKKWIDDNMNDFCKKMQKLFGVKLDNRSLSKDRNKLGTDIKQWEELDIRLKNKKNFGLKFKSYIEFYGNYRLQAACQ